MARWRERAIREVRAELDRFLNYPINRTIALGDYGTYDNKTCRFQWDGNIADLGLPTTSAGFQKEMMEAYSTARSVSIQGRLNLSSGNPSVDIRFRRTSALACRGFNIGYDQAHLVGLATAFSKAIRGGLQWNRRNVIVTELWKASGFTHLVSGGTNAGVQIEATAPNLPALFNFADPTLGLNVVAENSMNYCAVGQSDVNPYFSIHKLREVTPGVWSFYRYGDPS
ncbi:MAG: hypothetical protein P4M11_06600 [Candidatus Pacebacteria bacterium]|nr:hypothetical protein [Candidatus Paceibacterota bacterium]